MSRPLLPHGSKLAERIDKLCAIALTQELGADWSLPALQGRLNASIESVTREQVFKFRLFLDGRQIVVETLTPAEVTEAHRETRREQLR